MKAAIIFTIIFCTFPLASSDLLLGDGAVGPVLGEEDHADHDVARQARARTRRRHKADTCSGRSRPRTSILDIVETNKRFDTLEALVKKVGLHKTLEGKGPFTIFIPTDAAFMQVPEDVTTRLLRDDFAFHLKDLLLFHVVAGQEVCSSSFKHGQVLPMADGEQTKVKINKNGKFLRNVPLIGKRQHMIVRTDMNAQNGVIHELSRVLYTHWVVRDNLDAAEAEGYSEFAKLVRAAGLEGTLQDDDTTLTVLVPTNKAIKALPEDTVNCLLDNKEALTKVLTYHALPSVSPSASFDGTADYDTVQGSQVTVSTDSSKVTINGDSKVVQADILAFNGVSHGIDKVLLPPGFTCPLVESLETTDSEGSESEGTDTEVTDSEVTDSEGIDIEVADPEVGEIEIVDPGATTSNTVFDVLSNDQDFSTLVEMVQASGLESTLQDSSKQLTLFAPTNAAFAAIDDTLVECLLDRPTVLSSLLLYHVLLGENDSNDLRTVKIFKTVEGASLLVNGLTAMNGSIQVNDAEVIEEDIDASNGIIHGLDGVISFPGFSCP